MVKNVPPSLIEDFFKKNPSGEKILGPFFQKFNGSLKKFENLTVFNGFQGLHNEKNPAQAKNLFGIYALQATGTFNPRGSKYLQCVTVNPKEIFGSTPVISVNFKKNRLYTYVQTQKIWFGQKHSNTFRYVINEMSTSWLLFILLTLCMYVCTV